MKSTRYLSYQPLLKVLAQAAIADRPEGWTDGELCMGHDGPALACRLRRSEEGAEGWRSVQGPSWEGPGGPAGPLRRGGRGERLGKGVCRGTGLCPGAGPG